MPRGSDAVIVGQENNRQYGEHANAQDLIRAHAATIDPALQKVLARPTDDDATATVKENLAEHEGKFDLREGESLLDAAVHGAALVGVIEDKWGRTRKKVVAFLDSYVPPRLTEKEQRDADRAREEGEVQAETSRIREETQRRVEEARQQAEAEADEEIARIKAEADARVKAAEAAASSDHEPAAPVEESKAPARPAAAKPRRAPKPKADDSASS